MYIIYNMLSVYLGKGGYRGQTPPQIDTSLTPGETAFAIIFVLILIAFFGYKIYKWLNK